MDHFLSRSKWFFIMSPFHFIQLIIMFIPFSHLYAETVTMRTEEADIIYEDSLSSVAGEVTKAYPSVKLELAQTLQWQVDFRPNIVLAKDSGQFRKITGSRIIVAYAVPDRNLIVLDTSRVYAKPFSLEATLKHELCHLLLHRNIEQGELPRWLDEGVCQWTSGGIAELLSGEEDGALAKAVVYDSLIDIRELNGFPTDEESLILAYQESKSIVEYIVRVYGTRGLLTFLKKLQDGESIHEAARKSFSVSLSGLEKEWRSSLKGKHTWFLYFSNNIYTVVFILAALVTIYGFIKLVKRRRTYKDEEEEDV
jgi:hypothetical protein